MDFWDRISVLYNFALSFNRGVYHKITDFTTALVPFGANVLDTGAGTGELSRAAAKKASHVLCTDESEKMLAEARKMARQVGASNISFRRCNIFHIDEPDETFDVTIAGNVLHLLNNPKAAVIELTRVTKTGGKILLPCFATGGREIRLISIYKMLGFNPSAEYTPEEYCRMLAKTHCGHVKAKVFEGKIPCCYAVIYKK